MYVCARCLCVRVSQSIARHCENAFICWLPVQPPNRHSLHNTAPITLLMTAEIATERPVNGRTHTRTHKHSHTHTYTFTHAHIHIHTRTHKHSHTHTYTFTHMHTSTHTHTLHTNIDTDTCKHTQTVTHRHTHTCTHTHTHTHANIHTQTRAHTHTHMHTHTLTHTHANIHTQTRAHTSTHKHSHSYTHTRMDTHILSSRFCSEVRQRLGVRGQDGIHRFNELHIAVPFPPPLIWYPQSRVIFIPQNPFLQSLSQPPSFNKSSDTRSPLQKVCC